MKQVRNIPIWLWLLIASLFPVVSLLTPGLPITHDGQDHVARIANFYASLHEGIVVPRWASNLNWGYGHPILMFLYPLSSYVASFFYSVGFSLIDSTKLVFALSYIVSIYTMFIWLRRSYGENAALVGSLLYGFAPYRFVDLYVRGAIGEHVAFIFPPLICYFLYLLSKNQKMIYGIGLSISLGFLLLAHNAIAIMFLPIFALYSLYLVLFESKNRFLFLVSCFLSLFLGFGLASFFWIPAFFEGKYTLRDIVTAGEVLERFVPWTHFFYSPWNFGGTDLLSKSLGISGLIGIVASLFILGKISERKSKVMLFGSLLLLALTLALMTSISKPVWSTFTLLQKFQFPWRFLSVTTFLVAVIGAVGIESISSHSFIHNRISKIKLQGLFIAYCLLIILSTVGMWHPKGYAQKHESFFTGIYMSTTDTGESSPIWSIRFMEHTPTATSQVIDGEATISQTSRSTTRHDFVVIATKPTLMLENTVYFPGWSVSVDGAKTPIQFQNPNYRGLMTYAILPGTHTISVRFEDTKIRTFANYISIGSIGILFCVMIISVLWNRKK